MIGWKIASSIAGGVAVLSIIVILILSDSVPTNPCSLNQNQRLESNLAPMTAKDLYDSSELVVIGRITDTSAKCEGTQIWTHMQIEVEDSAKNPQNIKTLTAKSYGGVIGNFGIGMEHSLIFNKGERAFLYLYKDNPDDSIYQINPYSGILSINGNPDETVTARDILESFSLISDTTARGSALDVQQGTNRETSLTLESFFGYDSQTNTTLDSFTYYNRTDMGTVAIDYGDISALETFGLSVDPSSIEIQPAINGTLLAQVMISASIDAMLGEYDLKYTTVSAKPYLYRAGGVDQATIRINVTEATYLGPQPNGISLNIENYGRREFYQDEHTGYPTNLTLFDSTAFGKDAKISWPSFGPNYVISKHTSDSGSKVVFNYYKSLGIETAQIHHDEFFLIKELGPPPEISGRTFGFDWNQTNLDGTRAEPGTYSIISTFTYPYLKSEVVAIWIE